MKMRDLFGDIVMAITPSLFPPKPPPTPSQNQRVVVWVSAGAASAVAWKLAANQFGERAMGVYCDVLSTESPDNGRFLKDVEKWVGLPLTILKSQKYNTIDDVFEGRKYM